MSFVSEIYDTARFAKLGGDLSVTAEDFEQQ